VFSLLVPAAVTVASALMALRSWTGAVSRSSAAVLVGLVLTLPCLWIGREPAYGPRLWRAAVFGAYSGLDPRREELERVALSARTPAEMHQAAAAWRLYGRR
jgi:hypothetical protein